MIRALVRAVGTMIVAVAAATTVLVAALFAAVAIMVAGCYLSLWPPKQQTAPLAKMGKWVWENRRRTNG